MHREMCAWKRKGTQKMPEMFIFEGQEETGAQAMETEKEQ